MSVKPIPEGYQQVIPYLVVEDIDAVIAFVKQVFDAEEIERISLPDGTIMHAEVKIGDSVIMMGSASDRFPPMYSMLHIYTEDTDAAYERALEAGASAIMEPSDQFYGDRNAGVQGPMGNIWWIATHLEDLSPEELTKRAAQAARNR